MLRARGRLDARTTETLHALCRGWAAGLSLLIERWRRGELAGKVSASDTLLDVFESFAEESFKRVAQTDQLILLRLAELPRFTIELAVRASGDERARHVIEDLYRRNLFVDLLESESAGAEACYEFHSLFRAFLRKIAVEVFTPAELAATRRALARLLLERDTIEDAFALVAAADDWEGVTAIIYKHSEALLRQGRSQLLHSWIAKLPEPLVAQDAWLLHWSGAAQVGRSPGAARDILVRAYALATTNADVMCRVQSAAGTIETIILEYADFARLDPWIETLEGLLPALAFADADSHLRVYAALIGAILQRQGNPPAMQAHVEQTFALIDRASNGNLKVAAR